MDKKAVSGIMLTVILTGMLTLAFDIQQVKASGTIYIRADGSVDPSAANITSVDDVTYTFTGNIYDEIVVERDNIVVDGAGYILQGTGSGTGISLFGRTNVTIKNMEIKAFSFGIRLFGASNNVIQRNKVTANAFYGIRLGDYSNNNTVRGNTVTNNYDGIWFYDSSDNSAYRNNIINNKYGMRICFCARVYKIYHNNFINNTKQVLVRSSGPVDVWDDDYSSGGNYWSNYNGTDFNKGPYQNLTGSDGIADTPYVINENNTDRYPLKYPYGYVPGPDLNDDGLVDLYDIIIWALAFHSQAGWLNWNPLVDLYPDGIIDIFDAVIIAANYGRTDP